MKRMIAYAGVLLVLTFGSCKKEGQPLERTLKTGVITLPNGGTLPLIVHAGDTLKLTTCNTYLLDGKCYIDNGGTIIIEKGVTIRAVRNSVPALASALVVCRGGKIFATGTATQPITFTSNQSSPAVGDWGGVAILGNSTVNKTNPNLEGIDLPTLPSGISVNYGGTVTQDNSGIFQYVKIEYAGTSISLDNELNGLTLAGVGSGTTIDHIYVAFGADDAFGIFGGTVHLKYLVARSVNDDCFDFDFGYTGSVQFALGFAKYGENSYNGDANGIESDNDGVGSSDIPKTRPVISNMTIIGGQSSPLTGILYGSRWRRNTDLIFRNSIIMGYNSSAYFEGGAVPANFQYNLVHGFVAASNVALPSNNMVVTNTGAILLRVPFGTWCSNLDPRPLPASPAAVGANFSGLPTIGLITSVTYRGAFSPTAGTRPDWASFACDITPCQ